MLVLALTRTNHWLGGIQPRVGYDQGSIYPDTEQGFVGDTILPRRVVKVLRHSLSLAVVGPQCVMVLGPGH